MLPGEDRAVRWSFHLPSSRGIPFAAHPDRRGGDRPTLRVICVWARGAIREGWGESPVFERRIEFPGLAREMGEALERTVLQAHQTCSRCKPLLVVAGGEAIPSYCHRLERLTIERAGAQRESINLMVNVGLTEHLGYQVDV